MTEVYRVCVPKKNMSFMAARGIMESTGNGLTFLGTLVTAVFAFVGVAIGAGIQVWAANSAATRERKYRQEDEAKKKSEQDAKAAFVKAQLARHLEAYAHECAEAMWHNGSPEEEADPAGLPVFKAWPKVDWELLSVSDMMKVRDFPIRVRLMRDAVDGEIRYQAAHVGDLFDYYRDGAAKIGFETWQMAGRLRSEAGAEAFAFPDGVDFAAALHGRVLELEAAAEERKRPRKKRQLKI